MGSRVLLADDSVTIQKVVGIIFANEDYELTVVDSGDAALQKAREIKPDVMLVDALMPGKNGYEVCSEIRRDPQLSHIALLLMTGAFEAVDEEKNRQSGADDFITKPFESQTLIDMTGRLIALTRQRASQATAQTPPAAPQAAVAPALAAAPVPPPSDDAWGAGFDAGFAEEVSPVQAPAFTAPAPAADVPPVSTVAATTDDDLWGIFDMDAIDAPSAAAPVQIESAPVPAGDDDFFSFDTEPPLAATAPVVDEFVLEDEVFTETVTAPPEATTGFEPVGEEEFTFGEEELPEVPVEVAPLSLEEDFSSISFDEPVPVIPPAPPVVSPVMAAPAAEPAAAVAPGSVPAPEPVVAPSAAQTAPLAPAEVPASLDEEQLKMLLSKVSRDVIEKIVWEVVPDLAETIIREEIRKIKEGIGR